MDIKCKKCENPSVISLRSDNRMCKDCFQQHANHKFRSAFGKAQLIRAKEDVVVAVSGGESSIAMLNLIIKGLDPKAPKKMRFVPTLIYIDESSIKSDSPNLSEMKELLVKSTLPAYIFKIEQVAVDGDLDEEFSCGAGLKCKEKLPNQTEQPNLIKNLMDKAKTATATDQLLILLREKLLAKIAKQFNVDKVLLGDSATHLSSSLLAGVAQGKGSKIAESLAFADHHLNDITFVRPMREFQLEEVKLFNNLLDMNQSLKPLALNQEVHELSLLRLTNNFVKELQSGFDATVSTVFRTGMKIAGNTNEKENQLRCRMCGVTHYPASDSCSAQSALLFSHKLVESLAAKKATLDSSTCQESSTGFVKNQSSLDEAADEDSLSSRSVWSEESNDDDTSKLCYSCRLVIHDMDPISSVPSILYR